MADLLMKMPDPYEPKYPIATNNNKNTLPKNPPPKKKKKKRKMKPTSVTERWPGVLGVTE